MNVERAFVITGRSLGQFSKTLCLWTPWITLVWRPPNSWICSILIYTAKLPCKVFLANCYFYPLCIGTPITLPAWQHLISSDFEIFCQLNRWEKLFHGFCFIFPKLLISLGLNICWLFVFLLQPTAFYYFSSFFPFWSHWMAYGILVLEPAPPELEAMNHWTAREIPLFLILWYYFFNVILKFLICIYILYATPFSYIANIVF